MGFFDSKLFSIMDTISRFIILNIIWALMCLPVVTIYHSTAALAAVLKHWVEYKDNSIFPLFFVEFKKRFKQSIVLGLFTGGIIAALVAHLIIVIKAEQMNFFLPVSVVLTLFISAIFIHIIPVQINSDLGVKQVIKKAVYLTISSPKESFSLLIFLMGAVLAFYVVPVSILLLFSPIMYHMLKRSLGLQKKLNI